MRDSLRTNFLSMLLGQLITWGLTAVMLGILPRYLGPKVFGSLAVGSTIAGLVGTIAILGIPTIVTREVARQREKATDLVSTALVMGIALVLAGSTVAIVLSAAAGYRGTTLLAICLSCGAAPLVFISSIVLSIFNGFEVMKRSATLDVLTKLGSLVGIAIVILLNFGLVGLLTANIVMTALLVAVQIYLVRRMIPITIIRFSPKAARMIVKDGIPFTVLAIGFTLYTAVDVLMLSLIADETAVGIYSVPARLFGTMLFLPVILVTVVFPRLAEKAVSAPQELADTVRVVLKITITFSVAASLFSVLVSDRVLVTVLGEEFERSKPLVVVMALSVAPTSIGIVASRIVFATDRQGAIAWLGIGGFVAKILLGIWMIPLFRTWFDNPALGSAAGLLLTEIGIAVGMARFIPAATFDPGMQRFIRRSIVATLASAPVLVVLVPASPLLASLAAVAVFGAANLFLGTYGRAEITRAARWAAGDRFARPQERASSVTS